jgi:formamidopyrimidine-DNA glycosylase
MPELPEVETVRLGLEPVFTAVRIAFVEQRRKDLRFPFPRDFVARLSGRKMLALRRRAKYLIGELDDGNALIMHLGMSGSFRVEQGITTGASGKPHFARSADQKHDHVAFFFEDGAHVVYNDPRRFGFMLLEPSRDLARHPMFCDLGIEPLGPELSPEALAKALRGRKAPLKSALLDQRIVAGLGNIYACEALHRAGLSPRRAAETLVTKAAKPSKALERLTISIGEVLREAITAGGSSLRDHRRTDVFLRRMSEVISTALKILLSGRPISPQDERQTQPSAEQRPNSSDSEGSPPFRRLSAS